MELLDPCNIGLNLFCCSCILLVYLGLALFFFFNKVHYLYKKNSPAELPDMHRCTSFINMGTITWVLYGTYLHARIHAIYAINCRWCGSILGGTHHILVSPCCTCITQIVPFRKSQIFVYECYVHYKWWVASWIVLKLMLSRFKSVKETISQVMKSRYEVAHL